MAVEPDFEQRWRDAEQIAEAAYRDLAPASHRIQRRMNRQQYTEYVFSDDRGVTPTRADTYLAVKEITTPDADYPNVRRFDSVTPGHTWYLRRQNHDIPDTAATALTIKLFVTADRTPMLRCDDRLVPASREEWASLAGTVLEPLANRTAHLADNAGDGLANLLFGLVFSNYGRLFVAMAVCLVLIIVFLF